MRALFVRLSCCALLMTLAKVAYGQATTPPNGPPVIPPDTAKLNLVGFVQPEYPPLAKAARIAGIVRASIVIDETGGVKDIKLISGHPMLAPAALQAIRKWRYKPFEAEGKVSAVQTEVEVSIPPNITQSEIDRERKFQDAYWQNERAGRDALEKGDLVTAASKLQSAQAAAEERSDDKWLELCDVLTMLGDIKERQNDYSDAEELLKKSLAFHQKHQRPDEAEVAGAEFNLAALYVQMQRLPEAESLLLESARVWELRIADAQMPEPRADYGQHLALSYVAAARIAAADDRPADAQARCRKAITYAEQWPDKPYMSAVRSGCDSLLRAH
jgi:TonB family protein